MTKSPVGLTMLLWLGLSAVGVAVIVALPDDLLGDGAVFRLSDRHGPSWADMIGIGCLLIGWLLYVWQLWRRREAIESRPEGRMLVLLLVVSIAVCPLLAMADRDVLLALAIAAAVGIQISLGAIASNA